MSTVDYWTITLDYTGKGETLTLCEPCALESTNATSMASDFVSEPFDSMTEAVGVLDAIMAMAGMGTSNITSSPEGKCAAGCGR